MFKSIFGRLFWTSMMTLLLVFFSALATIIVFVNNTVIDRQYELATKISDTVNHMTGYLQVEHNNIRARHFYVQSLENWADFIDSDIIITDLQGRVIESTNKDVASVPDEYIKLVSDGGTIQKHGLFRDYYEHKVFTVAMPVDYYGTRIGAVFINTMMPELAKTMRDFIIWFFICSTGAIIVAFAIIYSQSTKISKPINDINTAALDIAAGNFGERITVAAKDEVGQLASSFNFMADSIQKLDDMRNRFISDISHELRTPITSIGGFVGGILDGTIPPEKQEYYLNIVLNESNRLKKLVTDMLEMSKMSGSEYKLNVTEFDFIELIRICIIGFEQKITDKNLDVSVDFSDIQSVMVCADRDAIQRVLINLIDNAIKFSYDNTTVDIRVWVDKKKAYFSVGNLGMGIEKSELPHVFDRFYKIDTSRTNNSSGAGLGLSFVKNIMLLHKQSIWVDSNDIKEGSKARYTTFTFGLELA